MDGLLINQFAACRVKKPTGSNNIIIITVKK